MEDFRDKILISVFKRLGLKFEDFTEESKTEYRAKLDQSAFEVLKRMVG